MKPTCDRCHKETEYMTCSYFNTQMICGECERKEQNHPKFAEARKRENEELKSGNYNFPGVGLPEDLR